ncbi:GNAT family N-acetyltransferase [Pseudonocardia sp.]|uniref:GNAT family N-acetyltransferase n=1 Tax=Pseudonocardia sp. TaxID=60912 RepID=UPI003D0F2CCD
MTPPGIEIDDDPTRVDVDALHPALAASYWSPGVPRHVVEAAIAGSDCFGAYDRTLVPGRMVGFARLVTDRATFGWVADVIVLPDARGRGIGTALVRAVTERAGAYGLRRLMLATRDAHELYRPHGFADAGPGVLMERLEDPARLYGS